MTHIHTDHSVNSDHCAVFFFIYHMFPVVLSGNPSLTGNIILWISHLYILIYLGLSMNFHFMISALLFDFTMILWRILLTNTHPKNHGLWFSEQTNLGIRRNFLPKNGCGVNVKGSMPLNEQRNKYNNLLNSTKKYYIKSKTENAQSSKDLYKLCDILLNRNRDQCFLHMIVLHTWLILSLITSKIKLNWFAATLKNLWIHLLICYHRLPPCFMVHLFNSLELFLNLMPEK